MSTTKLSQLLADLKHETLDKSDTHTILEFFIANPTVDAVICDVKRTWEVNNIAAFEVDPTTGKRFFEYALHYNHVEADAYSNFSSDLEIEIHTGLREHPLPIVAALYTRIAVRFYIPDDFNADSFTLSYKGHFYEYYHRKKLASTPFVDDHGTTYRAGLINPPVCI